MKKKSTFTAVSLRNLMTFAVIVAFLFTGAGFYSIFNQFETYAGQVHQTVLSAAESSAAISSAPTQQTNSRQTILTPILNNFFVSPATSQTQATRALTTYAQLSHLQLGTVSASAGSTITVSFPQPVAYTSFLTFLTYIEHNLPKMNVASLAITRPANGGSTVNVTSLTIEMAVQ